MALVDNAWYVDYGDGSTTGYYAVTKWSNHTAVAGEIIRQNTAPAVGSERCFVCTTAGATGAVEPTWTNTRGALNTSSVAVYQECTGIAALNGDLTNTPTWTITATPPGGVKNTAVTLGQVISRDSGASYQICTIAGTAGNGAEPAFSNTAGTTTADNTVTWTSLGVVGNFTGWQAPHARLANAFASTWGQAGNSFYVASEHAETQSTAMTLTSPGTAAKPCTAVCVAKTHTPPLTGDVTTGASIASTGGGITFNAIIRYDGFSFSTGTGAVLSSFGFNGSNGADFWGYFKNCAVVLNTTNGGGNINIGPQQTLSMGLVTWDNCTVQFGAVGQKMPVIGSNFIWKNTATALVGATIPTTLVSHAGGGGSVFFEGVDLSAAGAGKTLIGFGGSTQPCSSVLKDCKLGASVTVSTTPGSPAAKTSVIRTDSAGTNYIEQVYAYQGTQTDEVTIVRTGGATDGTTVKSRKIVTTANSKWILPFESDPISFWNDSTSAITDLTIYGTTTGGGVPKDDEIWVDVEYLGAAGSPLGSFQTTTKANNLAASAATNNSSDSSTWAGGGAGNGFKITVPSFTPGQKGPITIYLKAAKASTTYYVDPKPSMTGVTVSKSYVVGGPVYVNELSSAAAGGLLTHPGMAGGARG